MITHVGIDVSKRKFDLAIHENENHHTFEMSPQDITDCIRLLKKNNAGLVVMEATGGYEYDLFLALVDADLEVAIINPRQARDFAKATGKLAKTDKIDAGVLALMAAVLQPKPTARPDENTLKLRALTARRRQLVSMMTAEKNRLGHAREQFVQRTHQAVMVTLEKQIAKLDQHMEKIIDSSPAMCRTEEILESVPGIGKQSAVQLIANLPEIGTASRRTIASLVGLAPRNRDSGTMRGQRTTGGGRKTVRTMLYMPTLAAIRHNSVIGEHYRKLIARGKEKMVAVVACMRKLLTILNALVAKNETWSPEMT